MTTLEQPIVEPQQSAVLTRPVRRVELAVPLHSILRDADDRRAPSFPRCGDLSIVWTNRWLAATVLVGGTITTAGPALAAEYPGQAPRCRRRRWAHPAWRAARPTRTRSPHY